MRVLPVLLCCLLASHVVESASATPESTNARGIIDLLWHEDGGIAALPSASARVSLHATDASLRLLHMFGRAPFQPGAVGNAITALREGEVYGSGFALEALSAVRARALGAGLPTIEDQVAKDSLMSLAQENGSFAYGRGKKYSASLPYLLSGTRDAVEAFKWLGASPQEQASSRKWLINTLDGSGAELETGSAHAILYPLSLIDERPYPINADVRDRIQSAVHQVLTRTPNPDMGTIMRCGWLIRAYSLSVPDWGHMRQRLLEQSLKGGFGNNINGAFSVVATVHALEALSDSVLPTEAQDLLVRRTLIHEARDGGFADWEDRSPTIQSTIAGLSFLTVSDGQATRGQIDSSLNFSMVRLGDSSLAHPHNVARFIAAASVLRPEAATGLYTDMAQKALVRFANESGRAPPHQLAAAARLWKWVPPDPGVASRLAERVRETEAALENESDRNVLRSAGFLAEARDALGIPRSARFEGIVRDRARDFVSVDELDACARIEYEKHYGSNATGWQESYRHPSGLFSQSVLDPFPSLEAHSCLIHLTGLPFPTADDENRLFTPGAGLMPTVFMTTLTAFGFRMAVKRRRD